MGDCLRRPGGRVVIRVPTAIHVPPMYKVGGIDKTTLRQFDQSCLATPPTLKPAQIKKLRLRLRISQPVFARYLNTQRIDHREVGDRSQAA